MDASHGYKAHCPATWGRDTHCSLGCNSKHLLEGRVLK